MEVARYELRSNEHLSFGVPVKEGHDGYLMSPALCCHAASAAPPMPYSGVILPHTQGEGQNRYQDGRPWDRIF